MTGYGAAERETAAGRMRTEIRTVNHNAFRASLRLPSTIEGYEVRIRDTLREYLPRGHVTCSVRLEAPEGTTSTTLTLDEERARQYLDVLRTMKERLGLSGEVDVSLLARYNDVIEYEDEESPDVPFEEVQTVIAAAAEAVVEMRETEGQRLSDDFEARLQTIEAALETVVERAPERLVAERDRLRAAIAELVEDIEVDEERLASEIAYLAERWDIGEEIVRLRSHIELFRETLSIEPAEPVGKRLRFISQEMLRETNTIGAKANDVTIQHRVVTIKNEIDRLREQIENVE